MRRPSRNPSIEFEPHQQGEPFTGDPTDPAANQPLPKSPDSDPYQPNTTGAQPPSIDDAVGHSVWDEPAVDSQLAGKTPPAALTYGRWLRERSAECSSLNGWLIAIGLGAISGPLALVFGVCGGLQFQYGMLLLVSVGIPLMQELLKAAILVWTVERRPYVFCNRFQIWLASTLAAFSLLIFYLPLAYLTYGLEDPVRVGWYLIIFPVMQIVCSFLVGIGLGRVWKNSAQQEKPPSLSDGATFFILAAGIHICIATACEIWERFIAPSV